VSALREALEPVRSALLARARADAAADIARAAADAEALLERARARAADMVAAARAEGERDAAAVRAREAARAHREAREQVLRAQQDAYAELRRQARVRVRDLQDEPSYPALLDRLRQQAVTQLGLDATVRVHPDGGVVAESAGRRLDLSLPVLADRAVDDIGVEVTTLWAAGA
jgi:vacuolar-type H+-ATPase subunit E/Vma4